MKSLFLLILLYTGSKSRITTISLSGYPKGLYLLKLTLDSGIYIRKVVIR